MHSIQVFSRFDDPDGCAPYSAPCALTWYSDQLLGLERVYELRGTYNIASINMSLGGGEYTDEDVCDADHPSMKTIVDNLNAEGIVTIASAGNEDYKSTTKDVRKLINELRAEGVKGIIIDKLGVEESEVTPEASFTNDLGADSLDTVELVMAFEEAFDIEISDDEAEGLKTVGDAASYLQEKLG